MSARLVDLAISQTDDFPRVAGLVTKLVSKIDDEHVFLSELRKAEGTVSSRHPKEMLELLYAILPESTVHWPYGIEKVIGNIESAGWSKQQVKDYLHEIARRKMSDWLGNGHMGLGDRDADELVSVAASADNITVLVAGGLAGAFSHLIPLWGGGNGSRSVTKQIPLP